MKEWMLKHPIMTFLLADTLITGVLKCIACFSPNYKPEQKEDPEDALAEKIGKDEEETV